MNIRMKHDQRQLRWDILGSGRVARNAITPGIGRSHNGLLHAIVSRELKKAQEFSSTFEIEQAYGSYEELLADADVQAVYIALPNALHMPWTIQAAKSGNHVLCDKRLCVLYLSWITTNAIEYSSIIPPCTTTPPQTRRVIYVA